MTKNYVYRGAPFADPTTPFNYKHRNGLDFSKSINDPGSRLARVIRYLRSSPVPVSRKTILRDVFGIKVNGDKNRSWSTQFFSGMVYAGMIEKYGRGNATKYGEGKNSHFVVR